MSSKLGDVFLLVYIHFQVMKNKNKIVNNNKIAAVKGVWATFTLSTLKEKNQNSLPRMESKGSKRSVFKYSAS